MDSLEKINVRLRAELDAAREQPLDSNSANSKLILKNGERAFENRSVGTQTNSEPAGEGDSDRNGSHERLLQKHNVLTGSYQELAIARNRLESKLRSTQKSNREWIEYANGLEKKIGRLQGKLTSHGTASKRRSEGSCLETTTSILSPSSRELVAGRAGEASHESLRRELPNLLHMSERISELARNAAVETPGYNSPYPPQPISIDRSARQQEESGGIDFPLPVFKDPIRLYSSLISSDRELSTPSPKLLMDAAPTKYQDSGNSVSPESHRSGSTVEDVEGHANLSYQEQVDVPLPIIKLEPLSDSPVVISSRSIKKRKIRHDSSSNESKVKVEIVTSSPIGLAGFQILFPHESMDLDEIGEKMNTPKKRRQAMQDVLFGNNTIAWSRLAAELDEAGGFQHGENFQPKGNPLALQPASHNKQILPRTSGDDRKSKQRRLRECMREAVILGEDGENDVDSSIGSDTEIRTKKFRKLPTNAAELERRLTGLLEEHSLEKEVLTPLRPPILPAATAQLRAKASPSDIYKRSTPSLQRHVGGGITPNRLTISRDVPQSAYKPSTSKKRIAWTAKDTGVIGENNWDQEPLRERPVRRLGLEHFKINPHVNHGSDYAFTDVVRGRELRKCLPGCTKPECCGDKFRKFVEFAREHEEQTLSQEEQDTRLLEGYLGNNKSILHKMSESEKEELLIQARTRDLANKASKHRHAYERRRSPPGFWRSDFPSTQELQSDRQEAAIRQRELVQQRYEEAMRPGGRWLFRDE